jgi:hypothetical protein
MKIYKKPKITGQQRVLLNKYMRGEIPATAVYGFLQARRNEIPYRLVQSGTDDECIRWLSKYSITSLGIHQSINYWGDYVKKYNHSRYENIKPFKKFLKTYGIK